MTKKIKGRKHTEVNSNESVQNKLLEFSSVITAIALRIVIVKASFQKKSKKDILMN